MGLPGALHEHLLLVLLHLELPLQCCESGVKESLLVNGKCALGASTVQLLDNLVPLGLPGPWLLVRGQHVLLHVGQVCVQVLGLFQLMGGLVSGALCICALDVSALCVGDALGVGGALGVSALGVGGALGSAVPLVSVPWVLVVLLPSGWMAVFFPFVWLKVVGRVPMVTDSPTLGRDE